MVRGNRGAGEGLRDMVLWSCEVGAVAGAAVGTRVGMSGGVRADIVLWRFRLWGGCWMLKSGVSERCCCTSGLVKGLVLLGRAGSASVEKGPGEVRSVSCDLLRDGTGGGGSREMVANGDGVENEGVVSVACRSDGKEDLWERDEGRVFEDCFDIGTAGGERREVPLVRDWVVCQEEEEEERKSHASVSKGSGFHCASLWIPFSPFV